MISLALETDYSALKLYDPLIGFFSALAKASAPEHLRPVLNLATHQVKDMRRHKKVEMEEKNRIYRKRGDSRGPKLGKGIVLCLCVLAEFAWNGPGLWQLFSQVPQDVIWKNLKMGQTQKCGF